MDIKVRTITGGFNIKNQTRKEFEKKIINFFPRATEIFNSSNVKVRTKRLNLPILNNDSSINMKKIYSIINTSTDLCSQNEIRWLCAPFSTHNQNLEELNEAVLEIIKRNKNVFINYIVAKNKNLNRNGIRYASKLIKSISNLSNTGYDNFRFGTSFNCDPNTPFFPFTYQDGEDGFSVSLELVPIIKSIVDKSEVKDIENVRVEIIEELVPKLKKINKICVDIEKMTNLEFKGIDISLAPYPNDTNNSIASLIESFGIDSFGSFGTLFFTGFLTNILKSLIIKSKIKSVGFNGVMFSLLEDTTLANKSSTKEFSIDSLISYSSVCGCGIDMIPVPGDCFEEELSSLMLDIATLSMILSKPLGVRILPIPMKKMNEFTNFSHDFLTNSRIQELKNKTCFSNHFDSKSFFSFNKV
jgi:uncharacterized protein